MNRPRLLSLLVMVAALGLLACPPRPTTPPDGAPTAPVGVEITSQLTGTVAGGGQVNLTFVGTAAHIQTGLQVIFRFKLLTLRDPGNIGPVTITLDPSRESTGTLSSRTFPATHRQDFFLQINSEKLGTLVADAPVTLSAQIDSSPPKATYKSVSGNVEYYKQGDPDKKAVLTVQAVTSDVKPAASQAVDITSRVAATVADRQVNLTLRGTAVHLRSGRNVLFIAKRLVAVDPGDVGPLTFSLNPRRSSAGTLSSDTFPAHHQQSFFLQVESAKLGRLISDDPVIVEADIQSSPPKATYRFAGRPVAFYRQDDPGKKPVLTIDKLESDVSPPAGKY